MNRILEFSPSQEEAVVARILVLVHQAVDEHFPSAEQATRQFTKTVFSGEGERTAGVRAAPDSGHDGSQFGSDEATSPDGRPSEGERPYIPPPPPHRPAAVGQVSAAPVRTDSGTGERGGPLASHANPLQIGQSGLSRSTRLDATIDEMRATSGLDWTMRITIAAFIAGLILLAYFLWKFFTLT